MQLLLVGFYFRVPMLLKDTVILLVIILKYWVKWVWTDWAHSYMDKIVANRALRKTNLILLIKTLFFLDNVNALKLINYYHKSSHSPYLHLHRVYYCSRYVTQCNRLSILLIWAQLKTSEYTCIKPLYLNREQKFNGMRDHCS